MSIFDDVLSATAARDAGNHDINSIKIDEGLVDRTISSRTGILSWDAYEIGITREEAQRRIDAANTPEERARVMAEIRERAINRANLDTSTGRIAVMVVGKPAWHELGVNVSEAQDGKSAIILASQDYLVEKRQVFMYRKDGTLIEVPGVFAVARDDLDMPFDNTSVGSGYVHLQNVEAYDLLDNVIGEFGAHYETAGAVAGGRKVWMMAKMPEEFRINNEDLTESYIMITNSHDASSALRVVATSKRAECENTLRVASASDKRFTIRHSGRMKDKVNDAREALGLVRESFEGYSVAAEAMHQKAFSDEEFKKYSSDILDKCLDVSAVTAEQVSGGAEALALSLCKTESTEEFARRLRTVERRFDHRDKLEKNIELNYMSETCEEGTLWGAFNAVTEMADHYGWSRRNPKDSQARKERDFESAMTGRGDHVKQTALELAIEAMK